MSSICIIDTTIFCNILDVPNKSQRREETLEAFKVYIENDATLLLPIVTIYETGNHIGQNGNGHERRQTAKKFMFQVREAVNGNAPWIPTPMDSVENFDKWFDSFPDWAMQGSGLGDLSILQLYYKQCELFPAKSVFIWSYDEHLSNYSRPAMV